MATDNLTDLAIRRAQPGPKPLRLSDGKGLYLEVAPSGGKWWRRKYRYAGREKLLSMGTYPECRPSMTSSTAVNVSRENPRTSSTRTAPAHSTTGTSRTRSGTSSTRASRTVGSTLIVAPSPAARPR